MQQSNNLPEWSEDSAALLRQWLESNFGQIFFHTLASKRPGHLNSPDPAAVALQAKKLEGFELCVNAILSLATPPEKNQGPVNEYPDLDNPEGWPEHLQPNKEKA